ncbi:MAG: WYL domain-containing protein [Bacteroidaceae bacterium]|nr:WYL domain-containing protein [Bacteroidaceae bacterium]
MNKLLWLVRLLHTHPDRLTRKEILESWAEHDDRRRPMPPSTFYDKCAEIESIYGVKVVRNNMRYSLYHHHREGSDLLNFLVGENASIDIEGGQWLQPLGNAIDERRIVRMHYQSVGKPAYDTQLSPYCLHMAQGRCYVVGFSSHHSSVRTFALDRISQACTLTSRFTRPVDFNAARYFQHSIGAFGGEGMMPQHVVLSCDEWLTAYLRQRPLHSTQSEPSAGRFELDVALTKDFIGMILSFGSSVEVKSPAELRSLMAETARKICDLYAAKN